MKPRVLVFTCLATVAAGGVTVGNARASVPGAIGGRATATDTTVLALRHATVIDGTGAPPVPGRTVLIRDGKIAAVYATGSRPLPAGARTEDLSGRWLIPGLIDAHVHLTGAAPDMEGYRKLLGWALGNGITSVRDMAGDDRILAYLSRQAATGDIVSPRISYAALMAGPTFFAEDGRAQAASAGDVLGQAPYMRQITGATDLSLAVAAAKGTGATALKLYANLPVSLVRGLTAEAHRQGLLVWTHATIFPAGPMDAVRAGADAISHSAYLAWAAADRIPRDYAARARADYLHIAPDDPRILAVLDSMKARGTILDATLWVFAHEAAEDPGSVGPGLVDWESAVTREAHARGVLVDAGTDDLGSPDDTVPNLHREMAYLVEHAGFTPLEAIVAATRVSAMAIGQSATRGTITPGQRADLVVLSADPTADIHNTRRVVRVFQEGRAHER
ncbi:MAG: amidohydrolase family protein [Candidatus Palauibacterales bacterium]|nr:amidohydrolase family protein [Candidatus Palauibacterales bacterium]MDP2528918.1 amidohydrolase family protein [Candidatus Palauibacterales bacterium]MDP2584477.1 amidohydrolase family protein [Candidatus Palauibacterales bacterium]